MLPIVDINDYKFIMNNWEEIHNEEFRKEKAIKGFDLINKYDASITHFFNKDIIYRRYQKDRPLKYGCNPYQDKSGIYKLDRTELPFKIINGNPVILIYLMSKIHGYLLQN